MVENYNNTKMTQIFEMCGGASCMMTQLSSLPWKDPQTKNLKPVTPSEFRPYNTG